MFNLNDREKLEALFVEADGEITAEQFAAAGLPDSLLRELENSRELISIRHGVYARSCVWNDEMYLLQQRYSRGIYSYETALYLHGYCEKVPEQYTMTFPKGYNAPSLKAENVIIKRILPESYDDGGVVEIPSNLGNPLRVYDIERTLCDIVRGSGSNLQIVNHAMKQYAAGKDKDIPKLMHYAERLRVKPKVERYMEILL